MAQHNEWKCELNKQHICVMPVNKIFLIASGEISVRHHNARYDHLKADSMPIPVRMGCCLGTLRGSGRFDWQMQYTGSRCAKGS